MFNKARIRLTIWYALTIMVISMSFSVVVYQVLNREVDRFVRVQRFQIERRWSETVILPIPSPPEIDPAIIAEAKNRIIWSLGLVNLGILFLAGLSGYMLSGRTLQPIKEMVDEQNRFVGDASHELRTPLTSLKSACEVFLREKKTTVAESRKLVQESLTEINKMQLLSDAMLQLAQFQKPQRKLNITETDISEVVNRAVAKVQPMAKLKRVEIETNVHKEVAWGDAFELPDMLVILLDNAVKYSHEGGKVRVNTKTEDGWVKISVSDDGIGISENDLPHIFERFYRADSARTKTDTGGYGLGLAIAQKIAEENKGKITVESQLRKGTTFTISLPTGPSKKIRFS
jgi:signal transduction histidine kinase